MRKPSPLSSDPAERLDASWSLLQAFARDMAVKLKTDPTTRKLTVFEHVSGVDGDFRYMGACLIGPHPITQKARCWFYTNTLPSVPYSPEDNEKAEKIAVDILIKIKGHAMNDTRGIMAQTPEELLSGNNNMMERCGMLR